MRKVGCGGSGAGIVALLLLKALFPGCGKFGQDRAIAEITQAGGHVQVDENAPGRPVVRVDLEGLKRTGFVITHLGDDGLASLRPHLESLPRLRYLRITSMARISDAGLRHLEGLTQLETLELYGFITEAGVERLRKKLPNVRIHHSPGGF
jgi:hypothetical protein